MQLVRLFLAYLVPIRPLEDIEEVQTIFDIVESVYLIAKNYLNNYVYLGRH
jgi:hypothetical protein